jgi:NitT/TauT family transport system permease protein
MTGPAFLLRTVAALVALTGAGIALLSHQVVVVVALLGIVVMLAMMRGAVGGVVAVLVAMGLVSGVWGLSLSPVPAEAGRLVWLGALLPVLLVWLLLWLGVECLSRLAPRSRLKRQGLGLVIPLIFGATLLWLWEALVGILGVSPVILPPPSAIGARFMASLPVLWGDFVQTAVKGALSGYVMGCGAAVLTAIAVDRSPFLQRGLLPVGNFVAALPIVGIAPILVMWFGFDWQSKAAVVVVMVFFPMLVNTVEGLKASEAMQRDLMATYGASYWQSLWKLRLPAAMPFLFNGLKICTTLALIGAIVAEFFGSPTQGMGFRISTEVGRLGLDMVWSEIAVAALAGSAFYAVVAVVEKGVTFWHPSQRGR